MNRTSVSINVAHVASAIRACWEAEGSSHNAAGVLLNLSLPMGLQPSIATFTALMGAYADARLEQVLAAHEQMKTLRVEANTPFNEVALTTVLQINKGDGRRLRSDQEAAILLGKRSPARLDAARALVADFRAKNVTISSLGQKLERAMKRLDKYTKLRR